MSMIHEQNFFRSGVKRLFTGTPQEWLGELLQNAQRAGATLFSVQFPEAGRCVVHDNGHGLLRGREDLERMLTFSDSSFSQEVQENQHPMGMGIYALLANEAISRIRVESHALSCEIDTHQWLDDTMYRSTWSDRVVETAEYTPGFRMTIMGTSDLMEKAQACALHSAMSPFCGYADLLEVFVDGKKLAIDLPDTTTIREPQIVGMYLNNAIRISLFSLPSESTLTVNWYGQIIRATPRVPWRAYLEVRTGRPVTPRAPTRDGLVEDLQLSALYQWIEDQIFAWVCTQEAPKVKYVEQLFGINFQRASLECPFSVVQPRLPLPRDYTFSSLNDYQTSTYVLYDSPLVADEENRQSDCLGPKQVVTKEEAAQLLLLDDDVFVPLGANHPAQPWLVRTRADRAEEILPVAFELGMESLLRASGLTAYKAGIGVRATSCLWWRPGVMADRYHTTHLGEWGIGTFARDEQVGKVAVPPEIWEPVREGFIYVASESSGWNITDVEWIIGLTSSIEIVSFFEQYGCAALWIDDEREDESEDAYTASVDALIRTYLPNTIARNTLLSDLFETVQPYLQGHDVRTATVSFVLDERRKLGELRFAFSDGYEQHINFY